MLMPVRSFTQTSAANFRYGFNGQEKTDEIAGAGNHTTAEFWEYDVRTGRRWTLDPKPAVGISQYSAFSNNPIFNADPKGDSAGDPVMTRHPINPIKDPSSVGYAPYNVIGSVVNGGQSLLNKAGQYLDHPVEQLNSDAGALGDFVVSQYNYFTKTPATQIKSDVKDFFSNPDNYFHAAEDAFAIYASGKLTYEIPSSVPKINVVESFSLKPTAVDEGLLNGSFSITDWSRYPAGGIKPTGPFRLLEGSEYDAARKLANETNLSLRRADPDMFKGLQIHEIQPVKFGGSPTELSNKLFLTPSAHAQYTNFWNALMRGIKKP
jgi:hypothetical protein